MKAHHPTTTLICTAKTPGLIDRLGLALCPRTEVSSQDQPKSDYFHTFLATCTTNRAHHGPAFYLGCALSLWCRCPKLLVSPLCKYLLYFIYYLLVRFYTIYSLDPPSLETDYVALYFPTSRSSSSWISFLPVLTGLCASRWLPPDLLPATCVSIASVVVVDCSGRSPPAAYFLALVFPTLI